MIATCQLCKDFHVPWDRIGVALMRAHLRDVHGIESREGR